MKLINIPNIITCCNVICGCMAIFFGLQGELTTASLCIIGGAVFDFFDGMTARALHISGPIGKELDSLADIVSFGLAPSVLAYQIAVTFENGLHWALFLMAMIMTAFSALRLAKFNCDERQSLSFIGLPTPANALFWIGLANLNQVEAIHNAFVPHLEASGFCWAIQIIIMSILLICELPMFSLKIKPGHMSFKENVTRYTFLALCVIIIVFAAFNGYFLACFAPIILLYIIFSAIDLFTKK